MFMTSQSLKMINITRFAPSPTGYMHLGHAYSALFASANGDRFLVRMEDIDSTRCRPEYEHAILNDLAWIGLNWESPVRRQSEHLADYTSALSILQDQNLVYPCFCTRKDIQREISSSSHAPHGPEGSIYPGLCRNMDPIEQAENIAAGIPHALRLKTDIAAMQVGPLTWYDAEAGEVPACPNIFGDIVLARKDAPTSYHLAVTVDDHLQGITLVTRGSDLFTASHLHRLLQALLSFDPPTYHHHRLVTDQDGNRFAKRNKSFTLKSLRLKGYTPSQVRALAGWN